MSRALPGMVWLIAGAMAVLLLVVAGAYGFHRDELYFILAGRHPAFGYVDQPPLTPLLSAGAAGLLGVTPLAVRIVPALAAAAAVVVTADMARRLGASRTGQLLAALVLAISGWLGAGHLDKTSTYDVLFWTLALWLLIPLLAHAETARVDRWRWLGLGLVVGIALENKTLAAALPLTVGGSLLLLRRWDVLRSRWAWLAALLAAAIWAPNVAWQATHGFTQIVMAQHIAADQGGLGGRVLARVQLLALAGPLLFPVAIAGVVWLLRSPASRPWRPLGVAVLLELGLMLLVGGKSYYSVGYLSLAIAAGSIPLSGWLARGRRRLRRTRLRPGRDALGRDRRAHPAAHRAGVGTACHAHPSPLWGVGRPGRLAAARRAGGPGGGRPATGATDERRHRHSRLRPVQRPDPPRDPPAGGLLRPQLDL